MTLPLQDVGRAVKRVQHRHHRAMDARLTAELGISIVQWDALRHIAANPERSLHHLAELTFQTDQSFGALTTRMIRGGLIERVPGPGRALHHRLTPTGEELRRQGGDIADEVLTRSLRALSPQELTTLHGLLTRLADDPL